MCAYLIVSSVNFSINFYLSLSGRKRGGKGSEPRSGRFCRHVSGYALFWDFGPSGVKISLEATVILLFAQMVLGGGCPARLFSHRRGARRPNSFPDRLDPPRYERHSLLAHTPSRREARQPEPPQCGLQLPCRSGKDSLFSARSRLSSWHESRLAESRLAHCQRTRSVGEKPRPAGAFLSTIPFG